MNLTKIWQHSFSKKVIDFLFADRFELSTKNSLLYRFACIFPAQKTAWILLAAVFLSWYEGLLVRLSPFFSYVWVVPSLIILALIFGKKEIKINKGFLWALFFLIVALLSNVFAVLRGFELKPLLFGFSLWSVFFLTFFISGVCLNRKVLEKGLVWLSLPLSLTGIYQFLAGIETPKEWVMARETFISTRSFAFFGNPNILGGVLAMMAIWSFAWWAKTKNKFYLFVFFINSIAVVFTFSRSAWLGLFLGLIYILFFLNRKYLSFIIPFPILGLLFSSIRQRLFVVFSSDYLFYSNLDGRIWSLINGWHIFKKYPLFGAGSGMYGGLTAKANTSPVYLEGIQKGYTALYFTDNQFLQLLVQHGTLGPIAFLGFCGTIFYSLFKSFKRESDILPLGAGAVFVCFLAISLFANALEFIAMSLPLALILGRVLSNEKKE